MSVPEWTETADLANAVIDQIDAALKDVSAKASSPRVAVSAIACVAASTAHQAAGMALLAATARDEKAAYDAAIDHVMKVIGYRYADSIAHARQYKAEHPAGAGH